MFSYFRRHWLIELNYVLSQIRTQPLSPKKSAKKYAMERTFQRSLDRFEEMPLNSHIHRSDGQKHQFGGLPASQKYPPEKFPDRETKILGWSPLLDFSLLG